MGSSKLKLLYIFILLQPFIDLITALMTRFEVGIVSLGIIVRGLFVLLMIVYLLFINKSKYRRKSIIYLLFLSIFYCLYIVTKSELLSNFSLLFDELVYIFKYGYFLILLITIVNFASEHQLDRKMIIKLLTIDLILYAAMIIIPSITNTSFNSYNNGEGFGLVGWFYSANEISAILTMIYPFLLLFLDEDFSLKNIIFILVTIISIIIIGTKAPYYSMLAITLFMVIYYLFHFKNKRRQFVFVLLVIAVSLIGSKFVPASVNLEQRNECLDAYLNGTLDEYETTTGLKCEVAEGQQVVLLSGREALFGHVYKIYKNSSLVDKFLGIGFTNRQVLNEPRWSIKLVEMDLFDILFRYGIVGFILYMLPIVIIIIKMASYTFKHKFRLSLEQIIYAYATAIGIMFGLFIGHVFGTPSSSFYLVIIAYFTVNLFNGKKKKLNKDKITFLLLHLGLGGIETSTINTANSLCQSKDVKIICFYKLKEDQFEKVDKRITVKYLYDGKPNREEFLEALHHHQIINIIKNGLLAISILLKRYFLMAWEIKNIKEGIVISTRIEFSTILSRYGNNNILKVAQEHYHHRNNPKYIKKMQYNYADIDYVMALTEGLKKDYVKFLKGNNTKVIVMPNMLEEIPSNKSNLDMKRVIFVGRLDKIKRINELIDLANEVRNYKWQFNIVGDGNEKEVLEEQIHDLKLEGIVNLLGSKSHNEVMKLMTDSSIFILTSISEGLPMVLLEAMSVGVPCIAYETASGIGDIITDGVDGYIIKNRNKNKMIEKLTHLMNNKDIRIKMGIKAKEKALQFSREEVTKKWLDFIEKAN